MLDGQREELSSIARRSLHTTAPTSRMTRANHVSVTSWTVAPTYTCSRATSGSTCWSALISPNIECDVRRVSLGQEVEVELLRVARAAIWAAASPGIMPSRAWATASAEMMSSQLCNRARSSKTSASSGVPHRWAYCSESLRRVPTSAPMRRPGSSSASEIWASDAPQGTTTRPSSTSMSASSRQHLARIAPVPPVLFRGQMSTCGARSP